MRGPGAACPCPVSGAPRRSTAGPPAAPVASTTYQRCSISPGLGLNVLFIYGSRRWSRAGPRGGPASVSDWLQNSGAEGPALQRRGLGILEISDTSCQDRRDTLRRPCRRVRSPCPPPRPERRSRRGRGPTRRRRGSGRCSAGVAPRYDLLNHLLSASLDRLWRRRLARSLALAPDARLLDLCSGTGDQAIALARCGYRVVAGDFCLPMLALARPKFARLAGRRPLALRPTPSACRSPTGASTAPRSRSGCATSPTWTARSSSWRGCCGRAASSACSSSRSPTIRPVRAHLPLLLPPPAAAHRPLALGRPRRPTTTCPTRCSPFRSARRSSARLATAGFEAGRFTSLSGGVLALYRARRGSGSVQATAADGSKR